MNDKFLEGCMTLEDAIKEAFDEHIKNGNHYEVICCGQPITTYTGVLGNDMGECKVCGAEIRNVLSPHVSPLLLDMKRSVTHIPDDEFFERVGDRCWCIKQGNK